MIAARASTLGDGGDLDAPPGSAAWAVAMRLRLQAKLKERDFAKESLESARKAFWKYEGWRALRDQQGRPFPDWPTFCETRKPFGLGTTADAVDAEIVLRRRGRPLKAEAGKGNPITFSRGTGHSYLLARLERDYPKLAAKVRSGELKAKAAARIAGIVKAKTPLEQLHHWWQKASAAERTQFLKEHK